MEQGKTRHDPILITSLDEVTEVNTYYAHKDTPRVWFCVEQDTGGYKFTISYNSGGMYNFYPRLC